MIGRISSGISQKLVSYLTTDLKQYKPFSVYRTDELLDVLQPGDVLLVEGDQRLSSAIKFLTQSTWSHAAMYVGVGQVPGKHLPRNTAALIEADLANGVTAVPLSKYEQFNTRICRAHRLTHQDRETVVEYMIASLGKQYDLKNIVDLARYLLPNPPVPKRFRRQMLALGSGDPTRAICSSLIAQAFQLVRYPILPHVHQSEHSNDRNREILQIRHHSLFAPRDFDLSPYFQVVKPALNELFDYNELVWQEGQDQATRQSHSLRDSGVDPRQYP